MIRSLNSAGSRHLHSQLILQLQENALTRLTIKPASPCAYTEIRCVMQPSQSLQSRFFMAAIFSSDFDDAFTLVYSFVAVEVKGKNLKEIGRAIQNGRCEFIQEFHEEEFQRPGKDAPVIESIKFVAGEKLGDILSAYKKE